MIETNTNDMKTFETGNTYKMNWIGDADMVTLIKVVKRTEKTITIKDLHSPELIRCKINIHDNSEYIFPTGKYSMAPVLKAAKLA